MIITRKPGESDQDFRARAFAAAREHSANLAQELSVNAAALGISRPVFKGNKAHIWVPVMDARPRHIGVGYLIQQGWLEQATPMTREEFRSSRTATELTEPPRMSRLRAIWYTCGLVAASAVIAMAVFGMGN